MTDETSIDTARGEVGITLAGRVYPMLPTYPAVLAIEEKVGSVFALARRIVNREYFPTIQELAIIAAETIRAAGKDRGDEMLAKVSTTKIAELIFAEGMRHETLLAPFVRLLSNMCTGGKPKPTEPAPAVDLQ
jgi:hypothetical protein